MSIDTIVVLSNQEAREYVLAIEFWVLYLRLYIPTIK